MRTYEVKVTEDIVNKIQRVHSELDARTLLLNRLIETHKDDPTFVDSSLFKRYHDEFVEKSTEFDAMKNIISTEYIPAFLQPHNLNWSLDYATCVIYIDILCDCEIPELD